MKREKVLLQNAQEWSPVLFPVETVDLKSLLPDYSIRATDRQRLIVGEGNVIYGVQGNSYTLIPNQIIKDVIDEVVGDHQIKVMYNSRGEYSLNVHLPEVSFKVGTKKDTLQKSMIITNSYNGRAQFTIQGNVLTTVTDKIREERMKISFYRQVCENGLMGWADEFMSMDEYLQWLLKGQPNNYKKVKEIKTSVDDGIGIVETKEELDFRKTIRHKSLDIEIFIGNLKKMVQEFMNKKTSITLDFYKHMANTKLENDIEGKKILIEAGLPSRLANLALERMAYEEKLLEEGSNFWLLYNSANYVLFNEKHNLSVKDRYEKDETIFHNLNHLTLSLS